MKTEASWGRQVVLHDGESYVMLPRSVANSFDIVRLKDQLEVGAVWLAQEQHRNVAFRAKAVGDVSQDDLLKIVMAGIRGGLFV